ncbi:helix-turn-helix domain-containing protein [Nocardia sp. NPDC057227]|uniref:helix-turn-helix domain-containing protein n=1 Tax=Nocardia sp. NPDC057227 TaxID=3346056 RepID=UPI003640816C
MQSGKALRTAREAAGVSLRALARCAHYSPGYLSQVENGQRPVTPEIVAAYEGTLGADVGRLASATASPQHVDASALDDVADMLAATRRLEDRVGSVAVLPAVRGMAEMSEQFAGVSRGSIAAPAARLASEVSQFRGWLEHAAGADPAARRSLSTALKLAEECGDPDRLTHALSFRAYVEAESANYAAADALSAAAVAVPGAHPLLGVYERFQRARVLALTGEPRAAEAALADADHAQAAAEDETPPEAGYWYTPGFYGLQRARVLRTLGLTEQASAEVVAAVEALPEEHRRAPWAVKWRAAASGEIDVPH